MRNKKKTFFTNPLKALLSALVIVFFAAFSIFYFVTSRWIEGTVFAVIASIFCGVFYLYGSMLIVSKDGVTVKFIFFERLHLSWDQINEVGIIGERVVLQGSSRRVGTLYLYFSPEEMDDDARFQMGLKWPPKGIPYTVYEEEKLHFIQFFWESEIALYNVGKLEL